MYCNDVFVLFTQYGDEGNGLFVGSYALAPFEIA